MTIKLLKCYICEHWYRPQAHNNHCPHCGAFGLKVDARKVKYYTLQDKRLIEVVRGVPRAWISHASRVQ